MKKMLLLLAVVLGSVSFAFAGRNFSGVWRLTPISQMAPVDTVLSGAALISINMAANTITLIADSPRLYDEYVIDGDEHQIATRFGNLKYATSWEGDTLVIKRTPAGKSGIAAHTLRFTISPNGLDLQITCTREGEKSPRDVLIWEKR